MKLEITNSFEIYCNVEDYPVEFQDKKWVSVKSLKELINHIMVVEKCSRLEWLHQRLLEELEEK